MQATIAPTPKNGSVLKTMVITDQPVNMVYITTNYSQFKILTDNREVNSLHVRLQACERILTGFSKGTRATSIK